jgi:hypothetical protein
MSSSPRITYRRHGSEIPFADGITHAAIGPSVLVLSGPTTITDTIITSTPVPLAQIYGPEIASQKWGYL